MCGEEVVVYIWDTHSFSINFSINKDVFEQIGFQTIFRSNKFFRSIFRSNKMFSNYFPFEQIVFELFSVRTNCFQTHFRWNKMFSNFCFRTNGFRTIFRDPLHSYYIKIYHVSKRLSDVGTSLSISSYNTNIQYLKVVAKNHFQC